MTAVKPNRKTSAPDQRFDPGYFHVLSRHGWFTAYVSKVLTVSKKQGKVTYIKDSGNSKITINKKTGKVTVKKGLKKGTFKVKVKVKAAGNVNYKALTKPATFTVKVN